MAKFIIKKAVDNITWKKAKKVSTSAAYNAKTILEGGKGQLVGAIGELMMLELFNAYYGDSCDIDHADKYDYDIVLDGKFKLDVKTKKRGVVPLPNYNATVAAYSMPIQKCHAYYFASVTCELDVPKEFYYLGSLSKKRFKDMSFMGYKGQPEEGTRWNFTADCYNVPYGNLDMFEIEDARVLEQHGFEIIEWN